MDPALLPVNQEPTPGPLDLPVLVGVYPSGVLQDVVADITAMDAWLGAPTITIAGTFLDLETSPVSIVAELNSAWDNGYVPFVNLGAGTDRVPRTAADIASGAVDDAIRAWARAFLEYSNNGEKRAMIAPMQEANGAWTTYGLDPENYKLAFYRIQSIFAQEGVQRDWVMWVFAPNGWSEDGHEFERYYPGDLFVDAIGFSAYNFGACPVWADSNDWDTFDEIYRPYLDRMVAMALTKPIILAEIGSVEENGDREKWLQEVLTGVLQYPNVRGWVYFNRTESAATLQCVPTDYRVYKPDLDTGSETFKSITTQSPYGHWALTDPEMTDIMFNPIGGYFQDTGEVSLLSGQASSWYADWVNRAFEAGIMDECRQTVIDLAEGAPDMVVRDFCPDDLVTRAEAAAFLERGLHGAEYTPPAAGGVVFEDVASSYWAAAWIEAAYADGVVAECSSAPHNYCPESLVTQAQMAVSLLRARHGPDYTPPPATGTIFVDVPASHWAAAWIEQLALQGITGGCRLGYYCSEDPVTRAEMAALLVRTLALP
jgi:hypothetical protein